jgi:phage gp46-like protein
MSDVLLFHEDDGGEIEIENGTVSVVPVGLRTAAYLSLFGGNERDRGFPADDHLQWWGNLGEPPERRYRSETQGLLRSLPLVPASLRAVEGAALRDLAWMLEDLADDVRAAATMPALNRIKLVVEIIVGEETYRLDFEECRCS